MNIQGNIQPTIQIAFEADTIKARQPWDRSSLPFVFEEFFLGNVAASGFFEDRFGNVRRRFSAEVRGHIEDKTLILQEDFRFDNGEDQQVRWTIDRDRRGNYQGTSNSIVGKALGKKSMDIVRWVYRVSIPVGRFSLLCRCSDVFYQQTETVVLNRTKLRKFGFLIGEITIVFQKTPDRKYWSRFR